MAEVVAATHDAHVATDAVAGNTTRHHVAVGLRGRQLGIDSLAARLHLQDEVGQVQISIGAGHEVGMVVLNEICLHALGHASQHTENRAGHFPSLLL